MSSSVGSKELRSPASRNSSDISTSDLKTIRKRRQYLPAHVRKEQILSAAQGVFSQSGFRGASTREIAKKAGVNQSMIFELFETKEKLFIAAVVKPLEELLDGIRDRVKVYENAINAEDVLAIGRLTTLRHLESMTSMYPLLVQALFSDEELGRTLYVEHVFPLIKSRADAMVNMVRGNLDPVLINQAIFGTLFSVVMHNNFTNGTVDLSAAARQIPELVLFGSFSGEARLKKLEIAKRRSKPRNQKENKNV